MIKYLKFYKTLKQLYIYFIVLPRNKSLYQLQNAHMHFYSLISYTCYVHFTVNKLKYSAVVAAGCCCCLKLSYNKISLKRTKRVKKNKIKKIHIRVVAFR